MTLLQLALSEIAFYGAWWLLFVPIAYAAARWLGGRGILVGALLLAAAVTLIDLRWMMEEVRLHPDGELDPDWLFWIGVALRIAFLNLVLLPATVAGLVMRGRSLRARPPAESASAP